MMRKLHTKLKTPTYLWRKICASKSQRLWNLSRSGKGFVYACHTGAQKLSQDNLSHLCCIDPFVPLVSIMQEESHNAQNPLEPGQKSAPPRHNANKNKKQPVVFYSFTLYPTNLVLPHLFRNLNYLNSIRLMHEGALTTETRQRNFARIHAWPPIFDILPHPFYTLRTENRSSPQRLYPYVET